MDGATLLGGDSDNTLDARGFQWPRAVLKGQAGDDLLYGGSGDDVLCR